MTTTTNLIELQRLADAYAHCYAFVGDEFMPIARKALFDALETQSKQIAELEKTGNEWYEAHNAKRIQVAEQAKQIEALQADAERLDYVINNRAYVVSDADCCDGYWLQYVKQDGTWVQVGEYESPRAAIDAARKGNV